MIYHASTNLYRYLIDIYEYEIQVNVFLSIYIPYLPRNVIS